MAKIGLDANIDSVRHKDQAAAPTTTGAGYSHIFTKADGVYVVDENDVVTGPFGVGGLPTGKEWMTENKDGRDYPVSPNALDDEFDDESIDVKWTITNDPAGADGANESLYPGHIHVGLPEGADTFDGSTRIHQTPPTGSSTMEFVIRAAIGQLGGLTGVGSGELAEFAQVGVYLGNSADDEKVGACLEINNANPANGVHVTGSKGHGVGMDWYGPLNNIIGAGQFVYLKLIKVEANPYTSQNEYYAQYSLNGMIWWHMGQAAVTFSTACDEVGLYYRHPKAQTGTPVAYTMVDFFRRTA